MARGGGRGRGLDEECGEKRRGGKGERGGGERDRDREMERKREKIY